MVKLKLCHICVGHCLSTRRVRRTKARYQGDFQLERYFSSVLPIAGTGIYKYNGASEGFLSPFPSDQALDSIWLKEKQDLPYMEVVRHLFSKEIGKHKHNLKVI